VFPLRDNVPTKSFPVVTIGIIVANVIVWFWELSKPGVDVHVFRDGYYPCTVSGPCHIAVPFQVHALPWYEGVFTGMFMHASWPHIGFNMLFLWIFGNNIEDALGRAGLLEEVADNLDHPALRLSGGQQQRLCIARALAAQPEVLLLDEPCSALDPRSTSVIEDLVVKLREEVAVVIVTHNLQQAYRIADHVGFMYLGELVEYGSAASLFGAPKEQRTKDYVSGAFG